MKKIVFFWFLLLVQNPLVSAQANGAKNDVINYLKVNGTSGQYEFAYDSLLEMLKKQYPKTDSNTKAWAFLNDNKQNSVNEIMQLLVPIYQQNFSKSDINEMLAFYNSETGMQLVNNRSKMTEEQKSELNAFYNSEVGARIIEKQPLLTTEISKASENWSRLLYETAVSLLK